MTEFSDALTTLRFKAGQPTTRQIGSAIGVSHTTVADAVRGVGRPSWRTSEKMIRHLGGNPQEFLPLWLDLDKRITPPRKRMGTQLDVIEAKLDWLHEWLIRGGLDMPPWPT